MNAFKIQILKMSIKNEHLEEFEGAIGIDLGTTYSCVGVWENGNVTIIPNDQGNRITPSYVAFTGEERLVGDAAKNQVSSNPINTIYDAKRLIGRRCEEEDVKKDMKLFPFEVKNVDGKPIFGVKYKGKDEFYSPEEISANILSYMKDISENYLGKKVTKAVITIPAYFNDSQRQSTKDAGKIAGLDVLRIINEPTAAALAYGLNKNTKEEKNILVFDLGGGTFDVSMLSINPIGDDKELFKVLATGGNPHLGGEDFDNKMMDHFVSEFTKKNKKDPSKDKKAMRRLKSQCEIAKRQLSSSSLAKISLDAFFDGIDYNSSITKAKFEQLCEELFKSTLDVVKQVIDGTKKTLNKPDFGKEHIDDVILVGGSTRIPKVQELLSSFFDGKKLNKSVNPDEAVAFGAAIQGSILTKCEGGKTGLLIMDVTSLSLGCGVINDVMVNVIDKNTTIPCRKSKVFHNAYDYQDTVAIKIYEGERSCIRYNNKIGNFELLNVPKMLKGKLKIDVVFDIDSNGILKVSAEEKSTGKSGNITITNDSGRLSDAEIEEMMKKAIENKEQDRLFTEMVNAKNELEDYLSIAKKSFGDDCKIKESNKKKASSAISSGTAMLNMDMSKLTSKKLKKKKDEIEKIVDDVLKEEMLNKYTEREAKGPENESESETETENKEEEGEKEEEEGEKEKKRKRDDNEERSSKKKIIKKKKVVEDEE